MARVLSLACLAAILSSVPSAGAAERRPLTVADLWAMRRVGAPVLSPDGTRAALTVTTFSMDDNRGNSDLFLVSVAAPGEPLQLTFQSGADSAPVFSPDGTRLLFTSKRGDGPAQLHLLPLDGGEAERLTDLPMAPESALFSPSGERIYFAALTWPDLGDDFAAVKQRLDERTKDDVKAAISESRLLRYWDHYQTDGRVHHLFELDLATRKVRDLTPGSDRLLGLDSVSFALSPDGAKIAFAANVTEPPYRTLNFDVHLLDLASGAIDDITAGNPADDNGPLFEPGGHGLVYARNRRPEVHSDFTRLCRYDLTRGESTEWALDLDASPAQWTFAADGTLLVLAESHARTNLYAVRRGALELLTRGGTLGDVVAGPDGVILYTRQSITAPAELCLRRMHQADETRLTHFNDALLEQLDLGSVEDINFTGADGDEVQMFVVRPPGCDGKRRWPLLHVIHGGPHGASMDAFHYRWNLALFAAPGRVVAAVNFHGSTGFGQEFADSILGNHADRPFADLMQATDRLLQRGDIDPERLAAAGGSYGGYMVAWILGHTDRFRCLINHAGVYDLMAQFASDATWGRDLNYGAAPWDDPARIDQYSPSRYAANFATPTLILHGERDYRVPYTQGVNLHGVLTAKGVPSRIVLFPDENHWILKPQSAALWWREVDAWLDRHIGAGASP